MLGNPRLERDDSLILHLIADFDRIAANLAVLDVALGASRQVKQHGDPLTAVGAGETFAVDGPLAAQ